MRLGFGLITAKHHPDDPRSDVDRYREAIKIVIVVWRHRRSDGARHASCFVG